MSGCWHLAELQMWDVGKISLAMTETSLGSSCCNYQAGVSSLLAQIKHAGEKGCKPGYSPKRYKSDLFLLVAIV